MTLALSFKPSSSQDPVIQTDLAPSQRHPHRFALAITQSLQDTLSIKISYPFITMPQREDFIEPAFANFFLAVGYTIDPAQFIETQGPA